MAGAEVDAALPQVLPVADFGSNFDPSVPPTTGEEFLRLVRYEAQRCPDVVVAATINPRQYDNRQTVYAPSINDDQKPVLHPTHVPSIQWKRQVMSAFADQRQRVVRWKTNQGERKIAEYTENLPDYSNMAVWKSVIVGRKPQTKIPKNEDTSHDQDALISESLENEPHDSKPITESEVSKTKDPPPHTPTQFSGKGEHFQPDLIEISKAEGGLEDMVLAEGEKKDGRLLPLVSVVGSMSQACICQLLEYCVDWMPTHQLPVCQAQWLYGLLACLDRLMDADTTSTLRQLLRKLIALRALLGVSERSEAARINLLIVILGDYFGQSDLLQ
eukprot:comp6186_c1_seq1/m.2021 comp6186_c1_seq1/g.2021  ORF comp6186_c1_seq1/g.2021 comp6186_c1_seq1/m.2021 type:complete len:330 (-) comp6186_c1_seq1:28-1017(-)